VATTISTVPNNDGNNHERIFLAIIVPSGGKEYERHVVLKHPKKPAYPCKADMASLGLSSKGNSWEVVGA